MIRALGLSKYRAGSQNDHYLYVLAKSYRVVSAGERCGGVRRGPARRRSPLRWWLSPLRSGSVLCNTTDATDARACLSGNIIEFNTCWCSSSRSRARWGEEMDTHNTPVHYHARSLCHYQLQPSDNRHGWKSQLLLR